jgi:UDP-GlcNAc:undecaprenyl-phosphate GlcNAc-1-phosphate transferase
LVLKRHEHGNDTGRTTAMVWRQLTDHLQVVYGAAAALVIVLVLTPAVGSAARYLRLVERRPEGERSRPSVPRFGGLALFLGVIVPSVAFLPLSGAMRGIVLGAAVATTVGAVDDFRGLVWWQKLGGQLLAAAIPTGFGVYVQRFTFPIVGVHHLPEWVGVPLTVLGIVAVMNMVNFLDGLDGLAAGVCAISGATFCVIELDYGRIPAAVLAAIVCGASLGFLRHNFYPARIFMGDSGALLLGYTLATVSVQGLLKTAALATLVLPLLVLAVPVLDTSFVVAKRLKSGQPVYVADARHLHHRFMRIGFSQRRAVVYLWTWCATLAIAALATRFAPPHRRGDWSAVNLAIDVAAGALAIAFSLYVVYVLEIVKLQSPRARRREAERSAA